MQLKLRQVLTALNAYIRKEQWSLINNLSFHLKKAKENKINPNQPERSNKEMNEN